MISLPAARPAQQAILRTMAHAAKRGSARVILTKQQLDEW